MGNAEQFERSQLELMTTYQLREICRRNKIIHGVIHPLDKEELIFTIMRYMGKRQNFLIRDEKKDGRERLERYFKKSRIVCQTSESFVCQSQILVYEGLSLEYYDGYTIPYQKELAGTNAFLIGSDLSVCAVFNLVEHGEQQDVLYITKAAEIEAQETQRKDYKIFCVSRRMSECLFRLYYGEQTILPEHIEVYSIPLIDFAVRTPAPLTLPMAIDFGSVHTTAGVYLDAAYWESVGQQAAPECRNKDKIWHTVFSDGVKESMLLPSVIGVLAVEENEDQLLFGYDAVKLASASYVDEGFCVFYDIKRWIGEYDKEEEIIDRLGRRRLVRRSELLRRFFRYIIQTTENRLKCRVTQVHISSPVKQKYYFQKMFEEILPEYMVNQESMLDEGTAVLYHTISGMLQKGSLEEQRQYETLVIDCGGGTTDLCSYRFSVQNRRAAYKIFLETTYENGNTDFGGNNLTYRIMQLLKIALVRMEGKRTVCSVKEILDDMDTDIYRFVDEHGVGAFYEYLDGEYQKAEQYLPTRFSDFEKYHRSEYYKVKNNFYTLFHAAEQIKKLFYGAVGVLEVTVTSEHPIQEGHAVMLDKWKLSFREGDTLAVKKSIPEVKMNYFEIEILLSGEIYGMIRTFMEEFYQNGRIQEFSSLKLTGQTCKVHLCKDALKEFVPGKMIQFRKKSNEDASDYELKTACVNGALEYLRDKTYGFADIRLNIGKAMLPYQVTAYTHNGTEIVLVDGFGDWERPGTIARNMEDLVLPLYLKGASGEEYFRFQYLCRQAEFLNMSYEEIEKKHGFHIPQKETDSIENGDVKFFVWASQEEWGFWVVPVSCDRDELYLGRSEFFGFENDGWVNSFFDGKK